MSKRPTIQMIAEMAGVSRGTVDRVLNSRSYVRDEVRDRVLHAVWEAGYLSPREAHRHVIAGNGLPPLKLGVLLPNWSGHFRTEIVRGVEAACVELRDFQVEVVRAECQTDIPGEVVEQLERLTDAGASAIALCALNDLCIEEKISRLADAGVPVITFNSDLPESRRLCFIGQDYIKSGRIAAEMMSKCIPRTGTILATVGNLEFDGHRKRLNGFCERMREIGFSAGQIDVVETYNDYSVTYRRVLEALRHTPLLDAVYMANNNVAGCAEAIRAFGRTGKVHVIAHDASESIKRLLRSGEVDMTISQDMFWQGYRPIILLRELLQKGKQPEPEEADHHNISIICAENMG